MSYDVFPRHNLPFGAEDWGREVTDSVRGNSYAVRNLKSQLLSLNRSSAGQFGSFSRSVREVETQSAQIIEVPDRFISLTVPGTPGTTRTGETSFSIPLPPPADGSFRPALVQLFGQVGGTQNVYHLDWLFVEAFGLGVEGHTATLGGGIPTGWKEDIVLVKTLPPGTSSVSVRMSGTIMNMGTSSISESVGLENARLSVMYGGL